MKIALICNTTAAFPLMGWLNSQQLLVGLGIKEQQTDFSSDLGLFSQQINQNLFVFSNQHWASDLSEWLKITQADLVLVLGCPFKIPAQILTIPLHGFFNIHFGSLPKYAGPVPVFWQIKNKEPHCQLTIHQMNESFDKGDIAIEIPFELDPNQYYGAVDALFGYVTINGIYQLLDAIMGNKLILKSQSKASVSYTKRPQMADLMVDFKNMKAASIVALVKACNPWNKGAVLRYKDSFFKILEAKIGEELASAFLPGQIMQINAHEIQISCLGNSSVCIKAIYTDQGFLVGENMATLGFQVGELLG